MLSYLQQSIALDYPENLVVDIGSEKISFQQMIGQAAEVMGLRRFLIPVPVLSPRLSSYWLILFTPIPYKLASSLVEGLKSETIRQNDNATHLFSFDLTNLLSGECQPRDFRTGTGSDSQPLVRQQQRESLRYNGF